MIENNVDTGKKNFVMTTDWFSSDIHYKKIVESDIYNRLKGTDAIFCTEARQVTLYLYSIELFPPIVNELRVIVSLVPRDLSGTLNIIHEGQYEVDPSSSSAKIEVRLSLLLPDDPLGSGYSIFLEVELLRSGISNPFNWVVYPIAHSGAQLKRLPLRASPEPVDLDSLCTSLAYMRRSSDASCFVFFSVGPENAPPTSRMSFTPLNLSPRDPTGPTIINIGSMEQWAQSWISSTCSTSDINVSNMKSRIIEKIMNRYRG